MYILGRPNSSATLSSARSTREMYGQDGVISYSKLTLTLEWQDRGRRSAVSGIRLIVPCMYIYIYINKAFIHECSLWQLVDRPHCCFLEAGGEIKRRKSLRILPNKMKWERRDRIFSFKTVGPAGCNTIKIFARSNWRQSNRCYDSSLINAGHSVAQAHKSCGYFWSEWANLQRKC